jgi:hypothetical protein
MNLPKLFSSWKKREEEETFDKVQVHVCMGEGAIYIHKISLKNHTTPWKE